MYFLLSPAKNLDEKTVLPFAVNATLPSLLDHSQTLAKALKNLDVIDLQELMDISGKLAQQNAQRNQDWQVPFGDTAKPAVYLFDGDAYKGLDAYGLDKNGMEYLNRHLGILSGLYGLLRPLDNILPYRLEMGTKLKTANADDLYQFWGDEITHLINARLAEIDSDTLINTASGEYFGAVNPKKINAKLITPRFEDCKNGKYKVISFYAKRARGLMVRYAVDNNISSINALKEFDSEGYYFVANASTDTEWVFRREEKYA